MKGQTTVEPERTIAVLDFKIFQTAMSKQFKKMSEHKLFASTADSTALWDHYLASFPPGSNPIYKARTEHDCSCCRRFVKVLGGLVNIVDGKIVTLWDFEIEEAYGVVAGAMADYVRNCSVENIFIHNERMVGTSNSRQLLEDKSVKTWDHFYVNLPDAVVVKSALIGPALGESRSTFDVMKRSLEEISLDAIDAVLELIDQNSLYRGEEHKFAVGEFRKLKKQCCKALNLDLFAWQHAATVPASVSRIRNTVVGTLLTDISEGKELEDAVKAFESKVAPQNYKRPTALVTKAMITKAQETVNELGLTTALERRYATIEDITVNNILFADRSAKREMNVFEEMSAQASVDVKKLGKVEEVPVDDFISKILPSARTLEVLVENRHAGNLVSLVAPVDLTAKPLFKWPNGFSWSYAGDLADSIKEKVKKAGGNVTGDFRASLAWYNHDDLDLHLQQPNKFHIYYGSKIDPSTGGNLDVDMNAWSGTTRTPVENITYPSRGRMPDGLYTLYVNNFCRRESDNPGFEIEMEFDGMIYGFGWQKSIKTGDNVVVCKFNYSRRDGLVILESLPSTQATRNLWGLPTQTFHKVRIAMLSPNHWDARSVGNKHFFFMLEGCLNESKARGFFNEFLSESLTPHRKVLEIVGAKMKTDESDSQLSGIGFSSTQHDYILCRVTGAISRVVKVLI